MKTKKIFINILSIMFIFSLIFPLSSINVYAADEPIIIEANIDKTQEIPLTLNSNTNIIFESKNISPGETLSFKVNFKNSTKEEVQFSITKIANNLSNNISTEFLSKLPLTISINNAKVYSGMFDKVTTPVTGWLAVDVGKSLELTIEVEVPRTLDNTFQNVELDTTWTFESRGDVPNDPSTSSSSNSNSNSNSNSSSSKPEVVQTGEEQVISPIAIVMIIAGGLLVVGGIVFIIIKKKK